MKRLLLLVVTFCCFTTVALGAPPNVPVLTWNAYLHSVNTIYNPNGNQNIEFYNFYGVGFGRGGETGAPRAGGVPFARFTPASNITVLRVEYQSILPPAYTYSGPQDPPTATPCNPSPIIQISDGSTVIALPISSVAWANDTGPISVSFAAGTPLTATLIIGQAPANGFGGCYGGFGNLTVQYR